MVIVLLVTGGILLTIGDIFMKEWLVKNSKWFFIGGLALYFASLVLLSLSYKYENIAVASVIFETINTISIILILSIFYKDKLTTMQISGMVLGIVSLILLKIG